MKGHLIPVLRKEFIHVLRDPRSLVIVFLLPVMMILMYGYAITFDIKEIRLGVLDEDRTSASRELVERLTRSDLFKVVETLDNRASVPKAMHRRRILAALVIPAGFGKSMKTLPRTQVQLLVDGSNANTAAVAINTFQSFLVSFSMDLNAMVLSPPVQIHPRVWYNPDLRSAFFIVPGLVAVIMMMICALLTSVTIARERETGTMEQILVSPIRSGEIIFGKIIPYVVLALMDAVVIVGLSMLIFKVPFRGRPLELLIASLAYVYAALSLGVLISTRAKTQQVALIAAQVTTTLPSFLLSGYIFPISSLPPVLQAITYFVPARYFLVIIRGIMLKGLGLVDLVEPLLFLVGFGTILLFVSARRFKTNLEG